MRATSVIAEFIVKSRWEDCPVAAVDAARRAILDCVGVMLAASRLLGLDAAQTRTALAIAATQASGLKENFGTMTKPFHAGHAARSGVLSALLAREGFTASE